MPTKNNSVLIFTKGMALMTGCKCTASDVRRGYLKGVKDVRGKITLLNESNIFKNFTKATWKGM